MVSVVSVQENSTLTIATTNCCESCSYTALQSDLVAMAATIAACASVCYHGLHDSFETQLHLIKTCL